MNWNTIVRDTTRIIISFSIVGCYLYCVITEHSCATTLQPYAIAVLASQLGIEGLLKVVEGKNNGRYSGGN